MKPAEQDSAALAEPSAQAPVFGGKAAASGVRWSLLAVLARQGFQILVAILLARILGPAAYGIVSVAMIYVVLTMLLLDQGLASALVQRPTLTRRAPGAVVTLNLLMAAALAALTWFTAPFIAGFFHVDALAPVLQVLAVALPLKAAGITPRAMLNRNLQFRSIAMSDVVGAGAGAVAGVGAALLGAGYFSILYQVIATDLVVGLVLLIRARGPVPNVYLKEVLPLLAFSLGVFGTNGLAYFSRNIDNILVGRVLGVASLSLYSMAYRVLVIPVQLIGQTVNRVMFPAFSRVAGNRGLVAENLTKSTQVLAMIVVPLMSFIACAAPALVDLVLGAQWMAAAPLMSVLAIGGARETIFYITPSLMKGMGKAGLNLRYEVLATVVQVGGIIIGLQFGLFWVAVGYAAAGFLLTPVLLVIQSRLCGASVPRQLGVIWPPVHASLWGSAAYLLVQLGHPGSLASIALGLPVFGLCAAAVLFLFHRKNLMLFIQRLRILAGLNKK